MKYELFYLVAASKEQDLDKIKSDINKMVAEKEGVFEEKETLEKRKLSYEIKHETHGIYVAQRFELADPEKITSIRNKINLYPDVLRFIISHTDDLPELRSKEERIAEAEKRSTRVESKPEAKADVRKKEPKKPEEPKSEVQEKKEREDIDKKLEEILNI